VSDPRCHDCHQRHETGGDALLCDWRLGGEHRVRRTLTLLGVSDIVIDQTVADLSKATG
jgi:hypothetical protein